MAHINSQARKFCVLFLYQSEISEIFYFSEQHFDSFAKHFEVPQDIYPMARQLAEQTLDRLDYYDKRIESVSRRWKLLRMPATDRAILRLAAMELEKKTAPKKVVINEAVELAKTFGTEQSFAFINGILDALSVRIESQDATDDSKKTS